MSERQPDGLRDRAAAHVEANFKAQRDVQAKNHAREADRSGLPKWFEWLLPFRSIAAVLFIAATFSEPLQAALLPPNYLDAVVALGTMITPPQNSSTSGSVPTPTWFTEGTGFFYGYLVKSNPDSAKRLYEIYLVTARHVVDEHARATPTDLLVRVNSNDPSKTAEFSLPLKPLPGQGGWFFGLNNIDIAAIRVNFSMLQNQGFRVSHIDGDEQSATRDQMRSLDVSAGDGVFVLGFPMNLAGEQRNYVIVRQGSIARVSDMLDRISNTYLIDSFEFPGNSGGPVILRPEIASILGTKATPKALLIGVVIDYKSYSDVAVSKQTGRPRVVFEENSGLADVLPIDYVNEAISTWKAQQPLLTPATPTPTRPP